MPDTATARTATSQPSESVDQGIDAAEPDRVANRHRVIAFVICLAIALVWWVFLVTIAIRTANPITLNVMQLRNSDAVLVGEITSKDEVRVETVIVGDPISTETIRVLNLPEVSAPTQSTYLLPLQLAAGGGYRVTPTRLPNGLPLIYPEGDWTVEDVERIMRTSGSADDPPVVAPVIGEEK
ncbi:hypothetical protein [Stratiformator vulcanicus]|uniref:Uncharacterized protein n=1 Tax=Stratiformator vulcanicus TaxID=2527980 RepID=A0A517QXM7_9PLAN|nr:hypothetical protein [Stratiformator vulcanicus]QDT36391.1 hypothetical protein Pan189_07470 [Stratiformator vulcanicus]